MAAYNTTLARERGDEVKIGIGVGVQYVLTADDAEKINRRIKHASNPDVKRAVDYSKKYGIAISEYEELLCLQDGKCAICRKLEPIVDRRTNKIRRLAVDHDHTVLHKIRGLLCSSCNRALGLFGDDVELLIKAVEYLRR